MRSGGRLLAGLLRSVIPQRWWVWWALISLVRFLYWARLSGLADWVMDVSGLTVRLQQYLGESGGQS